MQTPGGRRCERINHCPYGLLYLYYSGTYAGTPAASVDQNVYSSDSAV